MSLNKYEKEELTRQLHETEKEMKTSWMWIVAIIFIVAFAPVLGISFGWWFLPVVIGIGIWKEFDNKKKIDSIRIKLAGSDVIRSFDKRVADTKVKHDKLGNQILLGGLIFFGILFLIGFIIAVAAM